MLNANPNPADGADSEWEASEGTDSTKTKTQENPEANPAPETKTQARVETAPVVSNVEHDEFPEGLNESFALLQKAEATPTKSKQEQKDKDAYIALLKQHIHALQIGTGTVHQSADDLAESQKAQASILRRQRWKSRAQSDSVVKEILAAHDALEKENKALKEQLSKIKK